MLNTLLKMEFKRAYKSFLIWTSIMVTSLIIFTLIYPLYKDIFDNFPPEMMAILEGFGGIPENILEYFAIESASMYLFIGPIYASMIGFNLVSVFEREKSAEILYTTNVPKKHFYISKVIVLFVLITAFSLLNYLGSLITMIIYDPNVDIGILSLYFLMMNISFLVIAIISFTTALLLKPGSNPLISMTLPIIFILIQFISKLTNNDFLTNLQYLTPLAFSDATAIIQTRADIQWLNLGIYGVLALVLLCFNYFKYQKRVSI